MSEFIMTTLRSSAFSNFFFQLLIIILLFLTGYLFNRIIGMEDNIFAVLLSFPTGLSIYVLSAYLILLIGIPLKPVFLCAVVIAEMLAIFFYRKRKIRNVIIKNTRITLAVCVSVIVLAAIAVSGILSISISNDSMYYFSLYPKALVHFGKLRREFNVFLTDVGQGAAIIGTLPYMFGFNENFGIQHFFNFSFLLLFAYASYERIITSKYNKKEAIFITLVIMAFMISSMPYYVVAKWVMANVYFMEYMFICAYTAYRFPEKKYLLLNSVLIMTLSTLRMEGGIFVLLLILCISTLKYSGKDIIKAFLLPMFIMQLAYDIRIFLLMNIDAPYTFLTKGKAAIQLIGILALGIYIIFVRDKIKFVKLFDKYIIIVSLLMLNLLILLKDAPLYLGNLDAFYKNLFGQSGWGFFPAVIIAMLVLTYRKGLRIDYFELLFVGFILITLVVCWARGDVLRENLSDSGNRVLLQVVPLAVYVVVLRLQKK